MSSEVLLAARKIKKFYFGTLNYYPGSIADGDEEVKEVTVAGAALGDFVMADFSLGIADLVLTAAVTAATRYLESIGISFLSH